MTLPVRIVVLAGLTFTIVGCGEASKAPDTSPAVGKPNGAPPMPPPIPPPPK